MRKLLWIVLLLLVVIGAPAAHADSFAVTFTCEQILGACPPPTAPDVTFPSPTLDVTYEGLAFAFTLPSSSLPTDSYIWDSSFGCDSPTTCTATIEIHNQTHSSFTDSSVPNLSDSSGFIVGDGSLTFTPITTAPEPSSVALMLLGVGLVFVMRKRKSQGHQLAA